jgi:hypothetical protein
MRVEFCTYEQLADIEKNHEFDIFQSPVMYKFYTSVSNHIPLFIAVWDDDRSTLLGTLLAVFLQAEKGVFKWVKRCLIIGSPPIFSNENQEQIAELLLQTLVKEIKNNTSYVEFRHLNEKHPLARIICEYDFETVPWLNVHNKISSKKQLWNSLSSSKRTQINHSLKNGAFITSPTSCVEVEQLYALFVRLYKQKKRPLPSFDFFERFCSQASEEDWGKVFVVEFQGKVIGGILCVYTKGKTLHEWYVVGEDKRYKGIYPSVMATWAALEFAADNHIQVFDFMGAGKPGTAYGVRDFKLKFGGRLVEEPRFVRINNIFVKFLVRFLNCSKKKA